MTEKEPPRDNLKETLFAIGALAGIVIIFCGLAQRDLKLVIIGVVIMAGCLCLLATGGPPKFWDKLRRLL